MNWKELIENIDKSKNNRDCIDLMELGSREFDKFDIPWKNEDETPLQAYWFAKWLCTDSWVGGRIYFYNDEFVAVSWQSARKAYEEFNWASKESYKKVGDYLEEIRYTENDPPVSISLMEDLNTDIGDSFKIEYGSQVLINEGFIEKTKEKIKIVKTYDSFEDVKKWRDIEVEMENGEKRNLNIKDVKFPYILKK